MIKKFLGAIALSLPVAATAAPESYTMDPIHTFPHLFIDHLGFATIVGRFNKTSGKFTIDRAAKTATLEVNVETASYDSGDLERGARARTRDEHTRSADFLNSAEFPRMTYKSSKVKFSGDNPVEIEGELMLLGVTRPLTLNVERWKCGSHPFTKKDMCGGNASGGFKRSDFGMKFGLPVAVGDEVRIYISFEAYKE